MRICLLSTHALSLDGWGRYTVEVVRGLRELGYEPVLITASVSVDEGLSEIEHYPILPPLFGGRRLTTLRMLWKVPAVKSIINTCDIVHCIVEKYAPLAALSKSAQTLFVLSVFGTWAIKPIKQSFSSNVFRWAFRKSDLILSISDYTRRRMLALMDLDQIVVLPGGVHPERFTDVPETQLPGWVGKEPYVLSVGALKPRKGQHVALEAVAIAREQIPDLHYVMVGSVDVMPEYVDRLKQRAADLGISDFVHALGQLPPYGSLVSWYQKATAFVLPSVSQGDSFEGLGFVFLEAAAASTASIGTLNCGAEEAIINGETGFLVPQSDPEALAGAITTIAEDDLLRQQMEIKATEYANKLSWQRLVQKVAAHYTNLLS